MYPSNQISDVVLDNIFKGISHLTDDHRKTLEKYTEIALLSLGSFGLKDLKNFPTLPTLEILELRQNDLTGNDLAILKESCPNLRKLKLGENSIVDLNVFAALVGI